MPQQLSSVEVPGSAAPGCGAIHRSTFSPEKLYSEENCPAATLYENFMTGVKISPDGPCLGTWKKGDPGYTWITYSQALERVKNIGSGLLRLNLNRESVFGGVHVGLYSINRAEWVLVEQACNAYSMVTVALYDTLGANAIEYIVNHAEMSVLVCSWDKLQVLLKTASKIPKVRTIISMDPLPDSNGEIRVIKDWANDKGILLLTLEEVERLGASNRRDPIPPKPNDLATICYTSGTTGDPKGALLLHKNFAIAARGTFYMGIDSTKDDVHISYLPLAHCYERIVQASIFYAGAAVGFFRGDVNLLVEDIATLKPTFFPSVPRLLNRIYAKLVAATIQAPGVRGVLMRKAYADKLANYRAGGGVKHSVWDRLLFSKVAAVLGGRVRYMISGSAPISPNVLEFLRLAFSCDVLEGYGQTEGAASCSITLRGDNTVGHVGGVLPTNEVRLVDIPDMGYFSTDKPFPRGEICVRGVNVFKGYYKDAAKTAETIDSEGWLHSGDVGMWNERQSLVIIDRKKALLKLSQGEYVAPEKIENVNVQCNLVAQSYVHGDSLQNELVCIVVPNPETLLPWAKEKGIAGSYVDLCLNAKVRDHILAELQAAGRKAKLKGFEIIKAVFLDSVPFSVENDLLTPTFKLKRQQASQKYAGQIKAMYAGINAAAQANPDKSKL